MKKATTRRTSIEIETHEITIIRQKAPGDEVCPKCGADTTHAGRYTNSPAGLEGDQVEPAPSDIKLVTVKR